MKTAVNPSEDLLLLAADTLGMVLREDPVSGLVEGRSTRNLSLGPWKIEANIRAVSDVITPEQVSFLVKVRKSLWFYLVMGRKQANLYVMDGLGLTRTEQEYLRLNSKSVEAALLNLSPSIHGQFNYDPTTRRWGEIKNADYLDYASIEQDTINRKSGY